MTPNWNHHYFKLLSGILAKLAFLTELVLVAGNGDRLQAQIIPDRSLGNEASVVTPNVEIKGRTAERIDGGAIRDSNLFHSFQDFNIGDLQRVYFANPEGITNIFSRVTGSNLSEIFGTLGVNGNANLFFINPNGIIFGENASLDVGGSFAASTANAIQFGDRGFFNATDPEQPPLLTVKPSAFFFNQINPGKIENFSTAPAGEDLLERPLSGLRMPDGKSLLLLGGDIVIDGGGFHAPGGQLELAGVAGDGTIGLNVDGNNLNLSFPEDIAGADISLTNRSFVSTSGEGGGEIGVWGRRVTLSEGSQIAANTLGSSAGGGLAVNATESVKLIGTSAGGQPPGMESGVEGEIGEITRLINLYQLLTTPSSGLFAETEGIGEVGDLTINTPALLVRDGAIVSAGTLGSGTGGNLTVSASESVQLIGASAINKLKSGLYTIRFGSGKAGNLTISARQLLIKDGAWAINGTVSPEAAGNLTVTATESVQLIGTSTIDPLTRNLFVPVFGIEDLENLTEAQLPGGLVTSTFSEGAGGNLTIRTGQLLVRDGALAFTGTVGSSGDGGNLTVTATESVQLIGPSLGTTTEDASEGRIFSGLSTTTILGTGEAGDLTINTPALLIQDGPLINTDTDEAGGDGGNITVTANALEADEGGQISTSTSGSSNAGNITLKIQDRITLAGAGSGLFANTEAGSKGDGGSIFIDPTTMIIRDGAQVAVNSSGSGRGGNIDLQAGSLTLDRGTITAETASNQGGDINLTISDLLTLRNNSQISTTAGTAESGGDGGDINIAADLIVAFPLENSDITANAFEGNGGNIQIDTQNIFGFELQENPNLSDITASSERGFAGTVNINTLGIEPGQESIELPIEIVDVSKLINQNLCSADQEGEFIITGKGGLSPSPKDTLNTDAGWEDWRITEDNQQNNQPATAPRKEVTPKNRDNFPTIIEAQGWLIAPNGNIVLTAQPTTLQSQDSWLDPFDCRLLGERE